MDRKTEHQTSILQALAIMNGKFSSEATDPDNDTVAFLFGKAAHDDFSMRLQRRSMMGGVYDSPFLNTRQKLDTLYLFDALAADATRRGRQDGQVR